MGGRAPKWWCNICIPPLQFFPFNLVLILAQPRLAFTADPSPFLLVGKPAPDVPPGLALRGILVACDGRLGVGVCAEGEEVEAFGAVPIASQVSASYKGLLFQTEATPEVRRVHTQEVIRICASVKGTNSYVLRIGLTLRGLCACYPRPL